MDILLTILHVLICLFLIVAVLLQAGKGGGLASALGGGMSSSSVLGGRSAATFLTKATGVLAAVFMLICLVQSFTYTVPEAGTSTATERVMEQSQGSVPPPSLGEGFLEEEAPTATEAPVTTGEEGGAEETVEQK